MKHTYKITGMTCNGCRSHVEKILSKVKGVAKASVNLEKAEATIEMDAHIKLETFQEVLKNDGDRYGILIPNNDKMKHTYHIHGMTCNGCRSHVEKTLSEVAGVSKATVDLKKAEATIEMESHISLEIFQEALKKDGGSYSVHKQGEHQHIKEEQKQAAKGKGTGTGTFYCPMHCEGEKTYDKPGDCPVCGMVLVEEQNLSTTNTEQWTCPMHPEVVKDEPGDCPICGMDLVPMEADSSAEEKTYKKLSKKFWIAVAFTLPIFFIAMSEMLMNNPLYDILEQKNWNWIQFVLSIPVVFHATWMFFERAYKSIKTWNLNMFTLIGIGAGVAWLFSVFGMLFPDVFPDQFKTEFGAVHVYFEATTVILTLVLMGQLLEARAHSKTNSAVKELLKLAPNKATKIVDGEEVEVSIDKIELNDILKVKPGDKIPVDGILADLGISSYQIDEGTKGFSIRFDGPLDMRMNQTMEVTAADILNTYKEEDLVDMFSTYGEVRNTKQLAREIIQARKNGVKFNTTMNFIAFLDGFVIGKRNRYLAQVFQALRIEVNDEMGALKEMLMQSLEVLAVGGRLAVMTFHSLEDRIVKNFMKAGNFEGKLEVDMFGKTNKPFKLLNKKPIEASKEELEVNNRSRSAKLRVAIKQ